MIVTVIATTSTQAVSANRRTVAVYHNDTGKRYCNAGCDVYNLTCRRFGQLKETDCLSKHQP